MKCLNCGLLMQTLDRDGVEFDHCYQCGSHWFDRGELKVFLGEHTPDEEDLAKRLRWPQTCKSCDTLNNPGLETCAKCSRDLVHHCPRDGAAMLFIVEEHNIELDFCPQCYGLWFDGKELEALLDRQGVIPDSPQERAKSTTKPLPEGCQICGSEEGELTWLSGFFRCPSCTSKAQAAGETDNAALKEEYLEYWRNRSGFERGQEALTERGHHELGRAIKHSFLLRKFREWTGKSDG